ncbi:hypothetical protein ASG79_15615 [Arthrobacter sp. Soil761]|jgi:hypothetical protein|nr:hypothetical protein ASG79_15615 [Arthrobacter sp. Soil761]
MDPRLLIAIHDVLTDAGIDVAVPGSIAGAKAGPAVRQSILNRAAMKNASTGTPIPLLRGVTAKRATMAAVAGGAKAAGGGGIIGGMRVLGQKSLQAQLAIYGITAAVLVAQIGIRYAVLVRRDRQATREAAADKD